MPELELPRGPEDDSSAPLPQYCELSMRALNVLKVLATELTGETPPKGAWQPPQQLLDQLTYKRLLAARNCGPQTTREIIEWAKSRGVNIDTHTYQNKSLAVTWQIITQRFSAGELSKDEIAEVLDKSVRRGNSRIPIAFQTIIIAILNSI
jgi:hypothetical protein